MASDARFQAIEEYAEIFSAYRMELVAKGERKCVYVLKHSDGMQKLLESFLPPSNSGLNLCRTYPLAASCRIRNLTRVRTPDFRALWLFRKAIRSQLDPSFSTRGRRLRFDSFAPQTFRYCYYNNNPIPRSINKLTSCLLISLYSISKYIQKFATVFRSFTETSSKYVECAMKKILYFARNKIDMISIQFNLLGAALSDVKRSPWIATLYEETHRGLRIFYERHRSLLHTLVFALVCQFDN